MTRWIINSFLARPTSIFQFCRSFRFTIRVKEQITRSLCFLLSLHRFTRFFSILCTSFLLFHLSRSFFHRHLILPSILPFASFFYFSALYSLFPRTTHFLLSLYLSPSLFTRVLLSFLNLSLLCNFWYHTAPILHWKSTLLQITRESNSTSCKSSFSANIYSLTLDHCSKNEIRCIKLLFRHKINIKWLLVSKISYTLDSSILQG